MNKRQVSSLSFSRHSELNLARVDVCASASPCCGSGRGRPGRLMTTLHNNNNNRKWRQTVLVSTLQHNQQRGRETASRAGGPTPRTSSIWSRCKGQEIVLEVSSRYVSVSFCRSKTCFDGWTCRLQTQEAAGPSARPGDEAAKDNGTECGELALASVALVLVQSGAGGQNRSVRRAELHETQAEVC